MTLLTFLYSKLNDLIEIKAIKQYPETWEIHTKYSY